MRLGLCRRSPAAAAAFAAALLLSACAHVQPIYNVQDRSIPPQAQSLALADIGRNIVLAGTQRHWMMEQVAPGQLKGTYARDNHEVHITVNYSQSSYSILFASAVNMEQQGGEIHHKYNEWIKKLDKDIQDRLSKAGSDRG